MKINLNGRAAGVLRSALLILTCVFSGFAAGEVDNGFNAAAYGLGDPTVNVIKKQPDGKYLVGGSFWDVNGVAAGGLARLNSDLTVDASFNPPDFGNGFGLGGAVFAIALQSDGKIIVAGNIFGANNVFKPGVKRLNPDGSLDTTFLAPEVPAGTIYYDLAVQADDKIIAGNQRLNADGSVDNTFTTLAISGREIEIQADGKILSANNSIGRFNADGTPDNTFTVAATSGTVEAMYILPSGKILVGGNFNTINGFTTGSFRRLNADGTLDLTFNQNMTGTGNALVNDITVTPEGKIFIVGGFNGYNQQSRTNIAKLHADGSLDNSFASSNFPGFRDFKDVELLPDGKLLVGLWGSGNFLSPIVRFQANGLVDPFIAAVSTGAPRVRRIMQQADGKIVFVGRFYYANGAQRRSVARLNADGTLDTSFVPYFNTFTELIPELASVAVQTDGKVITGGATFLARLNADGSRDTTFNVSFGGASSVNDLVVLPNGQILAVGNITTSNPTVTRRIIRFNADGSLDTEFALNQPNAMVNKMRVQPDGKILIAGAFTQFGAVVRGRIARLNADGTLDETFNPPGGANGDINNLDLQADGKIVVGGVFTGLNGVLNQNRVGRLNADGTLDTSFVQGFAINSPVVGLKVQTDNKVIVSGNFSAVGTTPKLGLARFNADGTLDTTFNPYINDAIPSSLGALDVNLQADGKILVGGDFTKMNGVSHVRVARLLNSALPSSTLFDYDGDRKADISVFRPTENKWFILQSSNSALREQVFAVAGDIPTPADFDGDGKTDLAVFRPSTGAWWYLSSINNTQVNVNFGQAGDIPRPSDFDGDGKTDFVLYRPSNSVWYRLSATGQTATPFAFGISEDKPLIGDFDGDGKSDPAIFRPSTGDWWYAASASNNQFSVVHWGQSGDIPTPGDFDADGKTDFVVYRPSNGGWYILRSGEQNYTILQFGLAEDKPVVADYDGDGKADVAVFRPSTGTWYLLQTTAGFGAVQWGNSSDIPTEGAFLP